MLKKWYNLTFPVILLVISSCNPRLIYSDGTTFDRTGYGKFLENVEILNNIIGTADEHADPETDMVSLPGLSGTYSSTEIPDSFFSEKKIDCNLSLEQFEVSPGVTVNGSVSFSGIGVDFFELFLSSGTLKVVFLTNGTYSQSCNLDFSFSEDTASGKIYIDGKFYNAYELPTISDRWFVDRYEYDNAMATASSINVGESQARTFHINSITDYQDRDWVTLSVTEGTTYTIITEEVSVDIYIDSRNVDTRMLLCDQDKNFIAENNDDKTRGRVGTKYSRIDWTADFTGIVFIYVEAYYGTLGDYQLTVTAE